MNRAYKIIMTNNLEIPVDEDEVENVLMAIFKKESVIVRQGVFNPSFYVGLVEDKKRTEQLRQEIEEMRGVGLSESPMKKLDNIFSGISIKVVEEHKRRFLPN